MNKKNLPCFIEMNMSTVESYNALDVPTLVISSWIGTVCDTMKNICIGTQPIRVRIPGGDQRIV